jgi:plastocyanin
MPCPPSRRRLLHLVGASASVPLAGCTVSALRSEEANSDPEYVDEADVVYEHEQLALSVQPATVRLGDTVEFEIRNQGTSEFTLGCHNPWALQQQMNDGWTHLTWTAEGYYDLCAFVLPAGERTTTQITLSEQALTERAAPLDGVLQSGTYRFLVLGTTPYLAVKFTVNESD